MSSTRSHGDTMHADLEAVRSYDPHYDADAGSARLAAALAVASGATALAGGIPHAVLPKAATTVWWAAIKASGWGPVALALAVGAGGAVTTMVASQARESVASGQRASDAERVTSRASVAATSAPLFTSHVSRSPVLAAVPPAVAPEPTAQVEPDVRPPSARRPSPAPAAPPPPPLFLPPKQAERGRSIRDEVREVATLRELLATEPGKVLVGIDGRREGAGSTLDEERAILAMEALIRLGRPDEALERARAFLIAHPRSAYATRARTLLERRAP